MPQDLESPDYQIPDPQVQETQPVDPIQGWLATRDPAFLNPALDKLQPKLASHVHRYGLGTDPMAMSKAKVLAAKALKTYDPASGTHLLTWIDRNMQPLSRFRRLRATAIKVPEKIQLAAGNLDRAKADFENEHGREPELDELSEAAGVSVAQIGKIRKSFRKMTGEGSFEGNLSGGSDTDYIADAMDIVWDEGDALDRKILEMKAGYGGKPRYDSAADIAATLGISPVMLSRRSARLGMKLDELVEALDS